MYTSAEASSWHNSCTYPHVYVTNVVYEVMYTCLWLWVLTLVLAHTFIAVSLPYDPPSAPLKSTAPGKKKGKTSPRNSHRNRKCCRSTGDESKPASYAGNTTPDALPNSYIIV